MHYSSLTYKVETTSVISMEETLKTLQNEEKAEEYFSGGGDRFDTWCGCGNMSIYKDVFVSKDTLYKYEIGTVLKGGNANDMIAVAKYIRHVLKDSFIKLSGTIIGQEGNFSMEMDKND